VRVTVIVIAIVGQHCVAEERETEACRECGDSGVAHGFSLSVLGAAMIPAADVTFVTGALNVFVRATGTHATIGRRRISFRTACRRSA
jgi:hypothetical protein